jgi:ParB family chromosome partitioning protein
LPSRPDFRSTAARRLAEAERELSPSIISLIATEGKPRASAVRHIPVGDIEPNPDQPRLSIDQEGINELAASVKEHGVLQPVLVRPLEHGRYQLIAGERRWRATKQAGLATLPAIVEQIDDDTALEIALIENLQREDLSPLDEAMMYERMTREHGYSLRKLAQKIAKDKGYIENRLRLVDAPPEVRQLVSLRKDTVSHAYELLKVDDPRRRRRLAEQVARGELSLVKLRERIEGRPRRERSDAASDASLVAPDASATPPPPPYDPLARAMNAWTGVRSSPLPITEDSLVEAKGQLTEALERLMDVLRSEDAADAIDTLDRANLAKYLTIAKLRLENAIALVRSADPTLRES